MKHKIIFCLILLITFCLSSCKNIVEQNYSTVEVKIVDCDYHPSYVTFIYVNKMNHPIAHPARYNTIIEYEGHSYTFSGQDIYEKYLSHIGEYTNATLEITTYDDETSSCRIIALT